MSKENTSMKKRIMQDFDKSMAKDGVYNKEIVEFTQNCGLDLIDIMNGDADYATGKIYTGLAYGRITYIFGLSGTGKTTLAIQMALGLTKGMENSSVYHLDIERACKTLRIKKLAKMNDDELFGDDGFYNLVQRDISLEMLHNLIKKIHDFKRENEKELLTPIEDSTGEIQNVLPPTVIVLDSLAMLTTDKTIESEELSSLMAGSITALNNNKLFIQIHGKLEAANIHLFVINHITTKVNTSFIPQAAQMNFLKQDESLKGGATSRHLANLMIRITTTSEKFGVKDEKYGEGYRGYINKLQFTKTRDTTAGIDFAMVYDQARGYQNELSNLEAFYDNGLLEGKSSFNFPGSDIKFTRKTFLTKLESDENLQKVYKETLLKLKRLLVTRVAEENVEDENVVVEQEVKSTRKRKSVVEVEETTQEEASE
jgi:RecA/RadA recombinase